MANGTPGSLLNGMKVLFGALTATMAVLSQTLIRGELIPEQIKFVGSIGALFIIVALLVTLGYYEPLRKRLGIWLAVAFAMLLMLVALQVLYVVTIENLGASSETHKYLIGYKLTDEGNRARLLLGRNKSESEFIADMGADRIPVAYGASYHVLKFVYAISYILFVVAVVLALGSLIIPGQSPPPQPGPVEP